MVGVNDYSPWQQVYAAVARLPTEHDVTIGTVDNRVGEFLRKAADKHDFGYQLFGYGPSDLAEMAGWCDGCILFWTPDEMGLQWTLVRQLGRRVRTLDKPYWDVCPDHYDVDADAIEHWALNWVRFKQPQEEEHDSAKEA